MPPLSEPTTLASDWVLAGVAAALGVRLYRAAGPDSLPGRLWALAFLTGSAGALAGGAVHGFAASLSPAVHAALWKVVLVTVGVAGSLVLAGAALATREGTGRTLVLSAAGGQLAFYLAIVSASDDIRYTVWNGAVAILALLCVVLGAGDRAARGLRWILLGLGLSAAGLVAQRAGIAASILNHNDVCHVLQAAALWPFYRAGRGLGERAGRPDDGRGADDQSPSLSRKTALSRPASSLW